MTREQRIKYYDDLLRENTERTEKSLPPTEEYKRLDRLTEEWLAQIESGSTDDNEQLTAVEQEVMDFLDAFERLLAPHMPHNSYVN